MVRANYHRAYFPEGQVLRRFQGLGLGWDDSQWSIVGKAFHRTPVAYKLSGVGWGIEPSESTTDHCNGLARAMAQ